MLAAEIQTERSGQKRESGKWLCEIKGIYIRFLDTASLCDIKIILATDLV